MVGILLAVGLNVLATQYHLGIDLTDDQRYTISDATVRVHLSRGRRRLADLLNEELEAVDDAP